MITEQTCRALRNYKKKIQSAQDVGDLGEIESELEAVLEVVRNTKKQRKPGGSTLQRSSSTAPKLRRQATWTTSLRSPQEKHESSSPTGSEANSPVSGGSQNSMKAGKDIFPSASGPGLGVEGLSALMQKANLAEV
ncbi:hypothetical protein MRB53_040694 [Persea americana]|nr:hypothetical protein MRB53_040694 [Persea americana]